MLRMFFYYAFTDVFLCYLDQTESLKQRTKKQKSDVTHPKNSTCKKCSQDPRDFSKMNSP